MRPMFLGVIGVTIVSVLVATSVEVLASTDQPGPAQKHSDTLPACITLMRDADSGPLTIDALNRSGASTNLVNIVDVQQARWSTPDGKRPAGLDDLRTSGAAIVRPVTMDIGEALGGPPPSSRFDADVLGGQVGCDITVIANQIDPTPGTYVAVTFTAPPSAQADRPTVGYLWPVKNNVVSSDQLGPISLDVLRAGLATRTP